ncbi:MAG: type II secretion system F family protein [Bryobacteraceae bacterium]|nr:type II secretion system F family protein [Bryobacteraceae bacterium]
MTDLVLVGGFFLFVLSAVAGAGYWFLSRPRPAAALLSGLAGDEPSLLAHTLRVIGENVPSVEAPRNPVRARLEAAGYRRPSASATFFGIKTASAALLAMVLGWAAVLVRQDLTFSLLASAMGAGLGYLVPDRVLALLISRRGDDLRRGLPAALDLMVLCIEAGAPLDQAVLDCSRELRGVFPSLAEEFNLAYLELRAGKSRVEVLQRLAARNREPELKKLTALLIDGDRFGTSLGPALRSHAVHLRTRRRQKAQEAARKVGVKLVFPVFFLIFPSVLLVTLGPALIKLFYEMLPALNF